MNFADDLINPPELDVFESRVGRVKHGKAIVVPRLEKSRGHGGHTVASLWKDQLVELLANSGS